MVCPKLNCRSKNMRAQRSVHPHTENEYPKRFAGTNGIVRARICLNCGNRVRTIELIVDEFDAIVQRGYVERAAGRV